MRHSYKRALVVALVILVLVLITFQGEQAMDRSAEFLRKTGVTSSHKENTAAHPQQHPVEHPAEQTPDQPVDKNAPPAPVPAQQNPTSPDVEPQSDHIPDCNIDMEHLREVKERNMLDNKFQYLKRYVRFKRTDGLERKSMTHVDQRLVPAKFKTVELGQHFGRLTCSPPLEVEVTRSGLPSTVNASDFMFGVSTTYSRFMDPVTTPINEWIFWLTDSRGNSNGGKLLLMLLDASDEELQEVANLLGDVGIDVDVYHSDSSTEMAKWLVTCDDDTFFPSMHGLIEEISKYDHTRMQYLGTLSEDVFAVDRHGSQAFGGGGVFLSVSMAAKITDLYPLCATEEKILESNSGWGPQGDIILRKCIYEHTDTRLNTVNQLWQLDILGDPSGFYESGIKPLSLHHYRGSSWHSARPGQFSKIAHTCGEDCIMQRFQTSDDFVISGYSVAQYPEGIDWDYHQLEGTISAPPENKGWNLDFMLGPQRPSLTGTGKKIAWELVESEVRTDSSVLQTYVRRKDDQRWTYADGSPMSNIDGIIELVWIPA
ncbi:glycosyltransferase family 31 [Geosmithia morbida]|uniref:Glycosyltransferase family 31 n=1 Tax=Geosmithia morbida TaxID=1094350 RepID=A0A9P4YM90_9HYPO|nr:glycosyltransferase family 31 [Geosmithia morbida]KAF4119571.1 glycosyltransferase family 31 [Geosmithia morbida]